MRALAQWCGACMSDKVAPSTAMKLGGAGGLTASTMGSDMMATTTVPTSSKPLAWGQGRDVSESDRGDRWRP